MANGDTKFLQVYARENERSEWQCFRNLCQGDTQKYFLWRGYYHHLMIPTIAEYGLMKQAIGTKYQSLAEKVGMICGIGSAEANEFINAMIRAGLCIKVNADNPFVLGEADEDPDDTQEDTGKQKRQKKRPLIDIIPDENGNALVFPLVFFGYGWWVKSAEVRESQKRKKNRDSNNDNVGMQAVKETKTKQQPKQVDTPQQVNANPDRQTTWIRSQLQTILLEQGYKKSEVAHIIRDNYQKHEDIQAFLKWYNSGIKDLPPCDRREEIDRYIKNEVQF